MVNDFNLSEKILKIENTPKGFGILFCNVLAVKEFIKRLKDIMPYWAVDYTMEDIIKKIDKLAGKDLI